MSKHTKAKAAAKSRKAKSDSGRHEQPEQKPPCQLYLITPPQIDDLEHFLAELDAALSAAPSEAPIACLQIRLKDMERSALIQMAKPITTLAQSYGAAVLINDDPSLVSEIGADGAHIGQEDMDYLSSRELLGSNAIIGVTCHDSKDLGFEAGHAGADYVAFGAFFDTPTKDPKARAEVELLKWWSDFIEVPCVAIGGITTENCLELVEAGADFLAVSSGVWKHKEGPAAAVKTFCDIFATQHSQPA